MSHQSRLCPPWLALLASNYEEVMINNVNNVNAAAAANAVEGVSKTNTVAQSAQAAGITDTVEISTAARLAAKVQEIPDVRADVVARVKAEIASGAYETPQRLEIAIDRLMEDLL